MIDKLILIDGDILVYQIGFSVEAPVYVVDGHIYLRKGYAEKAAKEKGMEVFKRKNIGSFEQAKINLKTKLASIFEDLGSNNYKMYITTSGIEKNFRHKIATLLPYKGNRTSEKPFYYKKLRRLLVEEYGAQVVVGQEADDQIGIDQYAINAKCGHFEDTYIASIDKDLRCLQGFHYHMTKREVDYVDEDQALKNFYRQILSGDTTDNIPGLVRLLKLSGREEEGVKFSYTRYLAKYETFAHTHTAAECFEYVKDHYKAFGFGDKEINELGRLLWIRRKENEIWEMQ